MTPRDQRRPPSIKILIQAIFNALRGQESEQFHEAVRVLDVLLRQHAAKQGCLLVRQCFFHNDPKNSISIRGGVLGCRGFHSNLRATQAGLSLNMDVSTTMIVKPGKVVDFLLDIRDIDWTKAKRTLKSLRIKTFPSNLEYKIIGLSHKNLAEIRIELKRQSSYSVQLINKTDNHAAFKVKTTNPKNIVSDQILALLILIRHVNFQGAPDHWRLVRAHGTAVGLPTEDNRGNSEVGHNALGAGRIFAQA